MSSIFLVVVGTMFQHVSTKKSVAAASDSRRKNKHQLSPEYLVLVSRNQVVAMMRRNPTQRAGRRLTCRTKIAAGTLKQATGKTTTSTVPPPTSRCTKEIPSSTTTSKRKRPATPSSPEPPPTKKRRSAHTYPAALPPTAGDMVVQTKRNRCMTCPGCTAQDCGTCLHCQGKRKYGGDGKCHMPCLQRYCHVLYPRIAPTGQRARDRSARYHRSSGNENTETSHRSATRTTTKTTNTVTHGPPSPSPPPPPTTTQMISTSSAHVPNAKAVPSKSSSELAISDPNSNVTVVQQRRTISLLEGSGPDRTTTNRCFSLTEYLSHDIDAQVFHDENDHDDVDDDGEKEDSDISNRSSTVLYGLDRPPPPTVNVCTGCSGRRDDELSTTDDSCVLLCDGVRCGREYHKECCIPPFNSIPDESDIPWYCYDCCKDGTTSLLQKYLDNIDKERVEYYSDIVRSHDETKFVEYRIQQVLNAKSNTYVKRKVVYTSPESELFIGAMIHSLALCDSTKLARTRGGNERRESLTPDEYIGKPIRLHVHDRYHDMYHTGRIVAYRSATAEFSWGNYQQSSPPSTKAATVDESLRGNTSKEYLIRFPAGKDNRKSTYYHWIRLEEHSLSIGTSLVWARSTSHWKPSILWLRTSLALIPTIHATERSTFESTIDASKTKHKVCALVRAFGEEIYSVINIRDRCVDLSDIVATEIHLSSRPENRLLYSLARTELDEQLRVQGWFKLKQINPIGPTVLSSRDYWSLFDLYPTRDNNPMTFDKPHLLPNIRRCLDRSTLVQMLHRRGYQMPKDTASSITCTNVSFDNRTIAQMSLNADPTVSRDDMLL